MMRIRTPCHMSFNPVIFKLPVLQGFRRKLGILGPGRTEECIHGMGLPSAAPNDLPSPPHLGHFSQWTRGQQALVLQAGTLKISGLFSATSSAGQGSSLGVLLGKNSSQG